MVGGQRSNMEAENKVEGILSLSFEVTEVYITTFPHEYNDIAALLY